jgi:hypothetical protein
LQVLANKELSRILEHLLFFLMGNCQRVENMSTNDEIPLPIGLQFFWYEAIPGEEARRWWGQVAGSMHRLFFLREELESAEQDHELERALDRLAYHLENYFIRIYELRERAFGLLGAVIRDESLVKKVRHPASRPEALSLLRGTAPSLVDPLERLLAAIHHDVDMRNTHTHNYYLSLGLSTGYDVFDPKDALLDVSRDRQEKARLENILRAEIKRLVEEYTDKMHGVADLVKEFLHQADPYVRSGLQ